MKKDLYNYLLSSEIEKAIRNIEYYEKATDNTKNPLEYNNELAGRIRYADKVIEYLCNREELKLTPISIYEIYNYIPNGENARNYIVNALGSLYSANNIVQPSTVTNADVRKAYGELFTYINDEYEREYFDDQGLKPILKDDDKKAEEYFAQYQYLKTLKTLGGRRKPIKSAVNWLTGDIRDIDTEINSYNDSVRKLNEVVKDSEEKGTSIPDDFETQKSNLEKERRTILDKCNEIADKIDVDKFTVGDKPEFFTDLEVGLERYKNDVKEYRAKCSKLNKMQKELDKLLEQYENEKDPAIQDQIAKDMEQKFNEGKALFNEATIMKTNIRNYSDVLFSQVTLATIRSEKDVVLDFTSVLNLDGSTIDSIDVANITDPDLRKYVEKYKKLDLAEKNLLEFFKNKARLRNPNAIFGEDVQDFNPDWYKDKVENKPTKKPRKPGGTGGGSTIPTGDISIENEIDLQGLEQLLNPTKKPSKSEFFTLESLISKIYTNMPEDEIINPKLHTDLKYRASKIKCFEIMPLWRKVAKYKKQGMAYCVVQGVGAVLATIFTFIPILPAIKGIGKLWGKSQEIIDPDVHNYYDKVVDNIMNLTDEETEFLMKHYSEAIQIFTTPILEKTLDQRIQLYINKKITEINERLFNLLLLIRAYANSARSMLRKANDEKLSPDERREALEVSNQLYSISCGYLDEYIKAYEDGHAYINGDSYEAYTHISQAKRTGMNTTGGMFSRHHELNIEELKEIADASFYKNPNRTPKERVDDFMNYTDKCKDATEYRRNILNLGSKVSVGTVEYNPFVSYINYEKDPLITGLISDVFMITSIANIVTSVVNMVKHNAMVLAQQQANLINQQNATNWANQQNIGIAQGNQAISEVNAMSAYGTSNVDRFVNSTVASAMNDTSAAKNMNEIIGAFNNGNKLSSSDKFWHDFYANASNTMKSDGVNLLAQYQSKQIGRGTLISSLRGMVNNGQSMLGGEIQNAMSIIQKQVTKGYNYDALLNTLGSIQNNVSLGNFNIDLMDRVLGLSTYTSIPACQAMTMITPNMSNQGLLNSLLGVASLGTGAAAISKAKGKSENTPENLVRDMDSEEGQNLEDEITDLIVSMKKNGSSQAEIYDAIHQLIENKKDDVPMKR